MHTRHAIALTILNASMGATMALGLANVSHPIDVSVAAEPADVTFCPADGTWSAEYHYCPNSTVTVDDRDYPMCDEEDCSDVPDQTGVWRNDGRDWLIIGENTWPVTRCPVEMCI